MAAAKGNGSIFEMRKVSVTDDGTQHAFILIGCRMVQGSRRNVLVVFLFQLAPIFGCQG